MRFLITLAAMFSGSVLCANAMVGFPFGPTAETLMYGLTALSAWAAFVLLAVE